jgi:uncharacterized membrane protein
MGIFSPLLSLLLTVVIIVGLAWLLISLINKVGGKQNSQSKVSSGGPISGSAQEHLKTRYARGEISREEYLKILADIE